MSIASVIKYEGDNSTFIWKSPLEDFNTQTQLIVHESQEAVFYMNGQILDVFQAGHYTLETQNIPLIQKFYNRAFGGETPFHCEVYFVNKTEQMAVKWGTDSKVEFLEPVYNFPIKIGANGEMSLRVEDSRRLLVKVVGTEARLTQTELVQKFRAFLMTKLKTYLANYIRGNSVNIFQIDEKLAELSAALHEMLVPDFKEYGVSLVRFFVTAIVKPEDDVLYKRFKELHFRQYADVAEARIRQNVDIIGQETEKRKMIIEAEGKAEKRKIEGYTYQQERGFDIAQTAAGNEGAGNMANLGIGLGVMSGVGGVVGGMVNDGLAAAVGSPQVCPKCRSALASGAKFCINCGAEVRSANENEVTCPHCGGMTPRGKYCALCGKPLKSVCPECGGKLTEGAKFCQHCGKRLEGEANE